MGYSRKNPNRIGDRGLTVEDIGFPVDIKERTYGHSRVSVKQGGTHNSICSGKNFI